MHKYTYGKDDYFPPYGGGNGGKGSGYKENEYISGQMKSAAEPAFYGGSPALSFGGEDGI